MSKQEYKNIIAFHPGYYVKEIIDDMEITQVEFAKRLGTTPKNLSELLSGQIKLSTDLAQKLSVMLGTSIELWINLEKTYETKLLEIQNEWKKDEEYSILKSIDYSYYKKFGLPDTKKIEDKISSLCSFFCISSLTILKQPDFLVNYRTGTKQVTEKNVINSRAWVQTAINIGKNIETSNFDKEKLISYLPNIRNMTVLEPDVFLPKLKSIFSDCGVSFVLLPHLKNCGINGAVKWLNNNKVILALNDRRNYADTFWFSLFHEIKHVLQHKTKEIIVSLDKKELETFDSELEQDADEFARNTLIPLEKYEAFISFNSFSETNITRFAKNINIHPGIVVGRLQSDKILDYTRLNNLKQKYKIVYSE